MGFSQKALRPHFFNTNVVDMPQRVALTNQGYYSIFPQGDRGLVGKPGLPGPQVSLENKL